MTTSKLYHKSYINCHLYLPITVPRPNKLCSPAIIVETLLGYKAIKIDTAEVIAAASAIPSINLKNNKECIILQNIGF